MKLLAKNLTIVTWQTRSRKGLFLSRVYTTWRCSISQVKYNMYWLLLHGDVSPIQSGVELGLWNRVCKMVLLPILCNNRSSSCLIYSQFWNVSVTKMRIECPKDGWMGLWLKHPMNHPAICVISMESIYSLYTCNADRINNRKMCNNVWLLYCAYITWIAD